MPKRPLRPCNHPLCPNLTEPGQGFCEEHRKAKQRYYDSLRETATKRGYDSRWRRYTEAYKAENPLCAECERQGIVTPVYAVDHIEPVEGKDDPRFWDPKNHQSLCETCHNRKTALEKGWGRNP